MEGLGNLPPVSYLKAVLVTHSPKFSILMNFCRLRSNCLALFHTFFGKFNMHLRLIIFFPVLEHSNNSFLKMLSWLPFPHIILFLQRGGRCNPLSELQLSELTLPKPLYSPRSPHPTV